MASTIKLEIVAPEKIVYTADINMLIVKSVDGELGILPRHLPLITCLVPHAMRLKIEDDKEQLIAVSGGFMEVQPDKITVLAASAELPIDIDVLRAQKAYKRAAERITKFKEHKELRNEIDLDRAEAALTRAKARLKATNTVVK